MKDNKLVNTLMWKSGAKFEMMNWVDYDNFSYEKFAELIIKECINIIEETNLVDDNPIAHIKEKFGIEQ